MRGPAHARRRSLRITALLAVAFVAAACGKKGPPLPPLRLVPAAVTDLSVHVVGQDVHLRFGLPTKNMNGPGRIDLEHVEIYAITMPPGTPPPANRDLLTKERIVGTVSVKPPPVEGEPTEPEKPDPRPGPGDRVSFVEQLTPEKIEPVILPPPPAPKKGKGGEATPAPATPGQPGGTGVPPATEPGVATPPATPPSQPGVQTPAQPGAAAPAAAAATGVAPVPQIPAAPPPTHLRRVYALRGISHGGRPGQPVRIEVPIVSPPPPVTDVRASFSEHAIDIQWQPPVAEPGAPPLVFNIYPVAPDAAPLNPAPQPAASFEHTAIEFGKEQCFVVRTVKIVQNVTFESESSSPPACTTPRDIFPPQPPKELRGIATEGAIDLTWEANTEADLAGYLVLRSDGADDTLRPLTKELIRETTYHDPTVTAGVRYVYAVVAVDQAGNRSKESARFSETAR